jgi:hypothetical protein
MPRSRHGPPAAAPIEAREPAEDAATRRLICDRSPGPRLQTSGFRSYQKLSNDLFRNSVIFHRYRLFRHAGKV